MNQALLGAFILLCGVSLANCASGVGTEECKRMASDLDKAYDAIASERSTDPQNVFRQFDGLRKKAESAVKNCPTDIKLHSISFHSIHGAWKE